MKFQPSRTAAAASALAAMRWCGTVQAQSVPVPFLSAQYDVTTVALTTGGPVGYDAQSGVLLGDAVASSADSVGPIDVATAGAIVGLGLLTTAADISAASLGNAVATAHFSASFLNSGQMNVSLDYSALDNATGSGSATTSLYVSLTSGGVTLFADYVQGPWQYSWAAASGNALLDLTLSSEVTAALTSSGAGNASGFGLANATVTAAVPEASSWLLMVAGCGAIGLVVRRRTVA